jgi:beta-galactosidase
MMYLSSLVGIFLYSIVINHGHGVAAASRDEISFNFGWRHRTGLTEWADPNSQPPEDTDPGLHPREVSNSYDDDDWLPVQLPHDALIATRPSQQACPDGCSGHSYIPRHVLWYRKEFFLPSSWKDSRVSLEFDGSFRNTTVWINGEWQMNHPAGYLPFKIPLDSVATFGQDNPNIIAVFVDPDNGDNGGRSHGSGWWYEGGGLYRNARLVRTEPVHFSSNGLFVHSQVEFDDKHHASAVLSIEASIENDDGDRQDEFCLEFEVFDPDRTLLLSLHSEPSVVEKGQIVSIVESSSVVSPKLWTTLAPALYKIKASLSVCSTGEELDMLETHHGFRSIRFDANTGFFLNEEYYKIRGFCDHDSFGILGMAVPDRVNLFRVSNPLLLY